MGKIIKKHQSFGSESQFPLKHVTDASLLALGKKKKRQEKISTMHIFCGDKALQIPLAQDQQSSPVPRVKATLAFDPNLQHL